MAFPKYANFIFGTLIILTTFAVLTFAGVRFSRAVWSARAHHVWSTMTVVRYTGIWISIAIRISVTIYKQDTLTSKCTLCIIYIIIIVVMHIWCLETKILYLALCKNQSPRSFERNRQSYKQNRHCSFLTCSCSWYLCKTDFLSTSLGSPIVKPQSLPSRCHIQSDTMYYQFPLAKLLFLIKY